MICPDSFPSKPYFRELFLYLSAQSLIFYSYLCSSQGTNVTEFLKNPYCLDNLSCSGYKADGISKKRNILCKSK